MKPIVMDRPNFAAGLMFASIGGIFVYLSSGYRIGSASQMGPAFFPTVLGGLLLAIGLVILVRSFGGGRHGMERFHLRPLLLVLGPVMLFGALLQVLGLVLAGSLLVIGSALASREFHIRYALPTALALVLGSYLVFVYGLGLPMPVWPGRQ